MKTILTYVKMLVAWWSHATWGTMIYTWLHGELVGTDGAGNRYYKNKDGRHRWMIFNGTVEGSRAAAEWHGWLHHTDDVIPAPDAKMKFWQKDHLPNLSGTEGAYHPAGSLARGGVHAPTTGDYESWSPNA